MIKKIIMLMALLMVITVSSASANDGGAYPDYNEYITYSIKTDCKEIGIGDEMTFTITITNHTAVPFTTFLPDNYFEDAYLEWGTKRYDYLGDINVDAYKTNSYEVTYTVPVNVAWYKKDDGYYIDLCPRICYMISREYEFHYQEYDLPYDFFYNMVEPEHIPIKLTNLKDGSELIKTEILNTNNHFTFYDISETDWAQSYTYTGEYFASLREYISIENIDEETMKILYASGVSDWDEFSKEAFDLYSGESIVAKIGTSREMLPDEILPFETTENRILFQDEAGQYYGIISTAEYPTQIHERPHISIEIECVESVVDEYNLYNVYITNDSDADIDDFFVYFPEDYNEIKRDIFDLDNTIKKNLKAGETYVLPNKIKMNYDGQSLYILRVGRWSDDALDYWAIHLNNYHQSYEIPVYDYLKHFELYPLLNDMEIFDLDARLQAQNNPQVELTPTVEPTASPTDTTEVKTTNTPATTEEISVEMVDSYYIPHLVFIALGSAGIIAMVLIIVLKKKKIE